MFNPQDAVTQRGSGRAAVIVRQMPDDGAPQRFYEVEFGDNDAHLLLAEGDLLAAPAATAPVVAEVVPLAPVAPTPGPAPAPTPAPTPTPDPAALVAQAEALLHEAEAASQSAQPAPASPAQEA